MGGSWVAVKALWRVDKLDTTQVDEMEKRKARLWAAMKGSKVVAQMVCWRVT